MSVYTIAKNTELEVQLTADYQDNGWSFSNGMAIHNKTNSGSIYNYIFRPEEGKYYQIKIEVSGIESGGSLDVYLGGTLFGSITQNGMNVISGTTLSTDPLELSTGLYSVNVISYAITEGVNDGVTIAYDTETKQYKGNMSFNGDMMILFLDDLISFKNGVPWVHDKNDVRNSFYGVEYPSIVKFYCNIEYNSDKDFYSLILNGTAPWRADVSLPQRKGKKRGQKSRLKVKNFRFEKGRYIAEFLRDMNDPRFPNELEALMKGAELQGQIMEITLTNNSIAEIELVNVEVDVSIK